MFERLSWCHHAEEGPYSSPASLAPYVGKEVTIEVRPGQTALLIRDREVRVALLPNLHRIRVCRFDEACTDPPSGEAKARRVRPEDFVVFVQLESFQTRLHPRRERSVPEWEGTAQLRVTEPRRFYESFLRHSEDLQPDRFEEICGKLVEGILRDQAPDSTTPATRDAFFARVGVKLRELGLMMERLALESEDSSAHRHADSTPALVTAPDNS